MMTELSVVKTLTLLLLPPGIFILLLLVGLLLIWRRRATSILLILFITVSLYAASIPAISNSLLHSLEIYPALTQQNVQQPNAQAIIILASGRNTNAPEYGEDTISSRTLLRVRYGARLHHQTGLPILVSGGIVHGHYKVSEAELMRKVLEEEFKTAPVWLEDQSRNTQENAVNSSKLLLAKGIQNAYLVTESWHMYRSVQSFKNTGLYIIPAPTAFTGIQEGFVRYLPSIGALGKTYVALHEYLGHLWYTLRY